MPDHSEAESLQPLGVFWWVFALRGGFALLFACVLFAAGSLFRVFFLDPVLITLLGLLLGFYVMGNGLLLGVASLVARDHALPHRLMLIAESLVVIALGVYIGFTLLLTPQSLGLLAGLHALIAGGFQSIRTVKLRHDARCTWLLGVSGAVSLIAALLFFLHLDAETRSITNGLAALEMFYGAFSLLFALRLHSRRA